MPRTDRDNGTHFIGVEWKDNGVGKACRVPGFTVTVMLANRVRDRDSLAQKSLKVGDHRRILLQPIS
jgi:hypothetical protein